MAIYERKLAGLLNNAQIRKYAMNCGGLSKGVTWASLNLYKVQFIDADKELGKGAYKQLMISSRVQSERFFANRTQVINAITKTNPTLLSRGRNLLGKAGKGVNPLSIALAALTLHELGIAKGSQRILEQTLFIDEVRAVEAWGAAGMDKIIANGRGFYWRTPHGQQLKVAQDYISEDVEN